jgi:CheY-like chemotaxis protein
VLLIDDDMVSREVVATVLTLSGYTVHTAVDGAEALKMLDSGECVPEVILMDAQMPGLSGVELVEALRERSRGRIFAISGSAAPDDVLAASDGFLMKPFGSEELSKALERSGSTAGLSSAPAGLQDEPAVNPEVLARFREMMPEASVREIYAAVIADLARRIKALEAAAASGDAVEVRRIGHSIKGGCAMCGAQQAARLGALLETASDQLDNSAKLIRDLRTAAGNLERMLNVEFPA